MEVEKIGNGSKGMKGQMFSLASLIFVLLMVASLLLFVVMSIGYDNLSQSSIISTSSTNYGSLLTRSADSFAYASGSTALSTLYTYEYNAPMRQDNFISNLSLYMQSLMSNAVIPNVPAGSSTAIAIQAMMGNAVFASYNSQIASITGVSSKQIMVNQTSLHIFQTNPYSINVRYEENVQIQTTSGQYNYQIPVNVSIPLNNTPDLFYAQQGISRIVSFSNMQGSVKVIGNDYATSGNTVGFVYGIVYQIPSSTTCAGLNGAVGSPLNSQPYSTQLILVDPNAQALTPCASLSSYGGLITSSLDADPGIPYLVFPTGSNVIPLLQNNEPALLYGPGLSVLNISNLISEASYQSYFASPFATSYSDRVAGDFQRESPNGIFTLFPFNRQAGVFNSIVLSNIKTTSLPTSTTSLTVSAWVYPTNSAGNRGIVSQGASGGNPWNLKIASGSFDFKTGSTDNIFPGSASLNSWQFLTATYSSGTVYLYLNGLQVAQGSGPASLSTGLSVYLGQGPSTDAAPQNFNGMIADVQLYNGVLTNSQVNYLYQEGIESIPISNVPLVGWWTLNGNSNDYSGASNPVSIPANVYYSLIPDYTRDSAFVQPVPVNTYPIPGLLSCRNTMQCYATGQPSINLGDVPLALGNGGISSGYLNGQSSNSFMSGIVPTSNVISVSAWVNPQIGSAIGSQNIISSGNFILAFNSLGKDEADFWVGFNGPFQSVVTIVPGGAYQLTRNQWYLLTGVFGPCGSSNCVTIYVNGVSANQISSGASGSAYYNRLVPTGKPMPPNSGPTIIGSSLSSPYNQNYFNGTVANIELYNTTLSQSEVSEIYRNGIDGAPVDTDHLVGWWPLNGNSNDYSGYGNTGYKTALSFRFVQSNYSQFTSYNSIGLSTSGATIDEWQAFGFPAHT